MINYIKGEITKKGLDFLVIENQGIGYHVNTSQNTLNKIQSGSETIIFTYLHVREDILSLFGFADNDELDMFRKLISVNGVGPKAGLSILSILDTISLKVAILGNDIQKISKASGIGKKTASKIILELKDKIEKIDIEDVVESSSVVENETSELIKVLMSLGFSQNEAKKSLQKINLNEKTENEIIKEALRNLNR